MSIIENAKEIADLVKKLGEVELYRKIVELEAEIIDLSRAKMAQETTIDELKKKMKTRESLKFRAPFYYKEGDPTPFCPACFENNDKDIHMTPSRTAMGGTLQKCPVCQFQHLP